MSSSFSSCLLLLLLSLSLLLVPSHGALQWTFNLRPNIPYRPTFANRLLAGNTAQFNVSMAGVVLGADPLKVAVSPLGAQLPGVYGDFAATATATTARFRVAANPPSKATADIPAFNISAVEAAGQTMLFVTVSCPVHVEAACPFSITVTTHNRAQAWPGIANFDKLPAGGVMYWEFKPEFHNATGYPVGNPVNGSLAADDIHITATTLRGRISIYVISTNLTNITALPSRTNAQWRQESYNNELLIIPVGTNAATRNARITQQFLIAVVADDASTTLDRSAVYSLQVSYRSLVTAQNFVPEALVTDSCRYLSDDIPTPGQSLAVGDWDQYCFIAPTSRCDLDMTLTSYSGEQDVYVWYNGVFQEYSAGTESDNLHLTTTAPLFYAIIIYTPESLGLYTPGRYNILFHTNCSSSVFGTLAVEDDEQSAAIVDRSATLTAGELSRQFLQLQQRTAEQTLEEKLHPDEGFRTFSGEGEAPPFFAAPMEDDVDTFVDTDLESEPLPSTRRLLSYDEFDLLGVTLNISYHAVQLTQGQPQFGQLTPDRVARFVYHPQSFGYDLTFELSRRSGGDPNLYIATSSFATLPFPHSAQWVANFSGSDYVTIDRMDPGKCAALGCFYHIAVLIDGEQPFTGFTLTVSEGEALTDLQNAKSYANRLQANEPDYLRFIVQEAGRNVVITLTDTGRTQPRMYVDTRTRYPNQTNGWNRWSLVVGADGNLDTGVLTINNMGPGAACTPTRTVPCIYYIQVISSGNTTYSIVASAGGATELRNAEYQEGRLAGAGQYAYYKFYVSPGFTRFAVSMLLIYGQANMYVSNSERLPLFNNASTYVVMRDYSNLNTPITIYENNPALTCSFSNATFCTFIIAVYSVSVGQTQFALLATEGLRASVGVGNGLAIRQTMPTNQTYYWWTKIEPGTRVQICVTVIAGTVSGYLSERTDNTYPDASNFDLRLFIVEPGYTCVYDYDANGGEVYWSLTNPSLQYGAQISVMFLQQSGDNDTNSMIQLYDGYPQAAFLSGQRQVVRNQQVITFPANPLIYLNFILAQQVQQLVVDLYSITGDADIYMTFYPQNPGNTQLRLPSRTYHQYWSNLTGSDVISITNAQAGRYIVGAFHTAPNALSDTILFVTASTPLVPQSIQEGLSVRGYVNTNLYKYFVLPVSARASTIEIRLTPTLGNPDLFAARVTGINSTTALWRSTSPTGLDTITITANDPLRPTNGSWNLYIAVHAVARVAQFTMVVTTNTEASAFVEQGVTIPGTVTAGQYNYYAFRPSNISAAIDISITRFGGGMYVYLSDNIPQPRAGASNSTFLYTTTNMYYKITPVATPRGLSCRSRNIIDPLDCVLYIGITNYNTSALSDITSYNLLITQPGDVTSLIDRNAQIGQVGARETHQYIYTNQQLTPARTIVFAVTASVGDVDIYVATTPNAGPSNFVRSSTGSGDDVVVFPLSNQLYYYIAVVNKLNSSSQYSLLGRGYVPGVPGNGAWTLQADTSFNDFCGANDYSYYYFYVDGSWPTLTISVTARIGDPDIYVNSQLLDGALIWPNTSRSRYKADMYKDDTLVIPNPPAGQLYIAIHSAVGMDSFYTISITGEGRTQVMSTGVTYTGELMAGRWQYYQLTLLSITSVSQLIFSLTSRTGDTDMYISDTIMQPSLTAYNWSSVEVEAVVDIVTLRNLSNAATGRTELHVGTYYIGVYAWGVGTSTYSLYASAGQRVTLLDGSSFTSSVYSGASVAFEAIYPQGTAFSVQTTPLSGSGPLYLYVSTQENIFPGRVTSYQWFSSANTSSQELQIPGSSTCATNPCRYTILVYTPAAVPAIYLYFSISTQTASTITAIVPGVPRSGSVTGSTYHYYTFSLTCASNVSVFLTALTGNPDLFVMQNNVPTRFNSTWQSNGVGLANDYVSFSPQDAYFRLNPSRSMIGRYYIAVFGSNSLTSSYTLTLSIDNQCGGSGGDGGTTGGDGGGGGGGTNGTITYIQLTNGQPQYGRVAQGRWLYYQFIVTPQQWPTGVTFALSPTDGSNPDLYITKDGSMPTAIHFSWASQLQDGADDIIYISANSTIPTPCIPLQTTCVYHLAVYGYTASSFTITGSTSGVQLGLQLDYSKDGAVQQGMWAYYSVLVDDPTQPLVVIVSPTSGNPDLYLEFNAQPTLMSITSKTFGVDVITVPEPSMGQWRIGVYGVGPGASTFSIVASQLGISLRNGRPQDDVLNIGESRYYFYEFIENTNASRPFRLQLDAISYNPQLEVYVRRDGTPSIRDNQFNLSSARGDALSLLVPFGSQQWRPSATWRVLVISRSPSAAYSITAAQGYPPIFVADGRPTDVGETVAAGQYRYFRMLVLSNLYPVTVSITLQFGSASLYASTTEPLPGHDNNASVSATGSGSGTTLTVIIPRTSLPGYVYAGVRTEMAAGATGARYSVLFSTGLTLVQANTQQAASCVQGSLTNAFVIYLPFNSSFTDDITMRVSGPANYTRPLAIYVTTNSSQPRATALANDWAFTLLDWENPFTISRNDLKLQACVDSGNCELRITLGCQSYSQVVNYLFSVQIGATYIPLVTGQGISGVALAADQDRYYTISAGSGVNGTGGVTGLFQVRVEPCVGNVALFVNYQRSGIPTANNRDAESMHPRQAQSVTITNAIPTGRVIATVRGLTSKPATYQVMTYSERPFEYYAPYTVNFNTTIWVAHAMSVPDGNIRIHFLQARTPQAVTEGALRVPTGSTGYMRYSVYWDYEPSGATMWTMCGANSTHLAGQYYTTMANITVTFKVPSDVRRYSVQVIAQYVGRLNTGSRAETPVGTYLAYNFLSSILPGQSSMSPPTGNDWPMDSSSSSSSAVWHPPHPQDNANTASVPTIDKVVLAFSIGVPIFVAICAVLLFLHVKHQRLMDNGGVELNERFDSQPSNSSSSTGGRGVDKFNRLVEDQNDTGAYVPPGAAGGYQAPGGFSRPGMDTHHEQQQHVDTNGGGDYGGMSSSSMPPPAADGGWGHGAASHYASHAQPEHEHHEQISGRGFYEL